MDEKSLGFLLELVKQGGSQAILLTLVYFLWKDNRRLTHLVEKNAEYTLELLLKVTRVVGKFNRIAGGGGEENDSDE